MRAVAPRGAVRVLLVGLGRAASLSLAALEGLGCEIVAGVDPAGAEARTTLPKGIPVHRSLDELPRGCDADLVLVATPTPSHPDVCRRLLELRIAPRVLCEKPLALDGDAVSRLLEEASAVECSLGVLYHYSFSPEVLWAATELPGLTTRHGPVVGLQSRFEDVYEDDLDERRPVLVSSWVDSGINALSVAARLVELDGAGRAAGRATLRFRSAGAAGAGTIDTSWQAASERKETTLRFEDGTTLALDHRLARAAGSDGSAHDAGLAAHDVRLARYEALLAAHLRGDAEVFGAETTVRLHRLLAAGSPPA